jgi:ATP-binding cassette subfamily C protein
LHGGKEAHLLKQCDFRDVSFGYGDKSVVTSANFALPVGEVATLIGPSGAGKTTIADLLVGLHEPDAGQVLIDGLPLSDLDLARWRSKIGYIPQENILFNDTVLENITLGDQSIGEEQAIEALRLAGAWGFVSALPRGLHEVIGVRGNLLSGGQKQRLSIARALIHKPELLILDEATSALDRETAREICDAVRGLRGNRTILAITHQSIWMDAADRVLRMDQGRVTTEPA